MPLTRRPWLLAGAAACALALGGCGDRRLPASIESRRSMPSCGSYTAPTEGDLPPTERDIRQCFLDALAAGREAEVTITSATVEGDPVSTIYRVLGPGEVELFVDASADRFSTVDLYHQVCRSVSAEGNALTARGCEVLEQSPRPDR